MRAWHFPNESENERQIRETQSERARDSLRIEIWYIESRLVADARALSHLRHTVYLLFFGAFGSALWPGRSVALSCIRQTLA